MGLGGNDLKINVKVLVEGDKENIEVKGGRCLSREGATRLHSSRGSCWGRNLYPWEYINFHYRSEKNEYKYIMHSYLCLYGCKLSGDSLLAEFTLVIKCVEDNFRASSLNKY